MTNRQKIPPLPKISRCLLPAPTKTLGVLLSCFFNTEDIRKTIQSIQNTQFPCDIIMLENPSKYSPEIQKVAKELHISRHYICNDNIEGNIWQLFLSRFPMTEYKYIALSEADVVLDPTALHEAIELLDHSGPHIGNISIDLHIEPEKYPKLPIRAWVPLPQKVGPYMVGATGFQFIIFKTAFLLDFLACLQRKELSGEIALGSNRYYGISDTNLLEFTRRRQTLWIRTKNAKLDHIGWAHYLTYDEYCQEKDKNLKAGKIRQNIDISRYWLTAVEEGAASVE